MNWIAIVWSGFVATTIATAFFWVFRSLGWTIFSPTVQLGGIFLRDPDSPTTETIGFFLLFLLGSTVFPALYLTVMDSWMEAGWMSGGILGMIHGLLAAAALPAIGTISASVRSGPLPHPGHLGLNWGRSTPLALVLGHGIYGVVTGAILAGF
jgi:hypothetical protein